MRRHPFLGSSITPIFQHLLIHISRNPDALMIHRVNIIPVNKPTIGRQIMKIQYLQSLSPQQRIIRIQNQVNLILLTIFSSSYILVLDRTFVFLIDYHLNFILVKPSLLNILLCQQSSVIDRSVVYIDNMVIGVVLSKHRIQTELVTFVFDVVVTWHHDTKTELCSV